MEDSDFIELWRRDGARTSDAADDLRALVSAAHQRSAATPLSVDATAATDAAQRALSVPVALLRLAQHVAPAPTDVVRRIAAAVTEFAREASKVLARRLEERDAHPLALIFQQMTLGEGLASVDRSPTAVALDVADTIRYTPELLEGLDGSIDALAGLGVPQRIELRKGVRALGAGDDLTACRFLLAGVEGVLWLAAEEEGVIDADQRMLRTRKPQPPVATGVSRLLDPESGLSMSPQLRRFLGRQLFTPQAHAIRHGRAQGGHAEVAVWAFIGLCGWVDRELGTRHLAEVVNRLPPVVEAFAQRTE